MQQTTRTSTYIFERRYINYLTIAKIVKSNSFPLLKNVDEKKVNKSYLVSRSFPSSRFRETAAWIWSAGVVP